MAQLEDHHAQAARLEHYRNRQEAAKGFEDDLEFCPSLSAEELAEIRRHVSQLMANSIAKPNITPPQPRRVIPIIDPANRTPLSLPQKTSATSSSTSTPTFYPRPGSPFSYGGYSPTLSYQSISPPHKATKSIPIVNPSTGTIVNMPGNGANAASSSSGFGGFYSDISVR